MASWVPSGSIENPFSKKRGVPPRVGGEISSETVIVVSAARDAAGIVIERPLIVEAGSLTVITPPAAADIVAVAARRLPKTESVKLWLVWPAESWATTVTGRSP